MQQPLSGRVEPDETRVREFKIRNRWDERFKSFDNRSKKIFD